MDYADTFVDSFQSLGRTGEAPIGISGSGNSPNVVDAVERALRYQSVKIGLCGSLGERIAIADLSILVPAVGIGQQVAGLIILGPTNATVLRERIEQSDVAETCVVASL